jgi:hypothetical protein
MRHPPGLCEAAGTAARGEAWIREHMVLGGCPCDRLALVLRTVMPPKLLDTTPVLDYSYR